MPLVRRNMMQVLHPTTWPCARRTTSATTVRNPAQHQPSKFEKPYVDHDNQFCTAKGKSKVTLFLLSFFAGGFGADWFYMSSGDSIFICVGIIKIFMFSIFPLIIFFLGFLVALFIDTHFGEKLVMAGIIIFLLAGLIWWFVDWIRIVSDGWR